MSNFIKEFDSHKELATATENQFNQLKRVQDARIELEEFNEKVREKLKTTKTNFESHLKILDKVSDDLQFIHTAIKKLDEYYKDL